MSTTREVLLAQTFVEIADTLVLDFDVIDMLTNLAMRSVELLDASAAGILLADRDGRLRVMASSSEAVGLLELFQIQNDEGPCMDCYASGDVVVESDLTGATPWPNFARESVSAGFESVCAVPMRLRDAIIGCLNLFIASPVALSEDEVALARALADIACIAIVQDRATSDAADREERLQHALDSRIVIEQAKGVIAERAGIGMDEAFARLRTYSRNTNQRLSDVATAAVRGTVDLDVIASAASGSRRR